MNANLLLQLLFSLMLTCVVRLTLHDRLILTISCFRVLNLEKKKETVKEKDATVSSRAVNSHSKANSDDDEDEDDDNFDEYIDWRAKKSYKKKNKLI